MKNMDYLDFEKPIVELEEKLGELQRVSVDQGLKLDEEIETLRSRSSELTQDIFSKLGPGRLPNWPGIRCGRIRWTSSSG